MDTSITAHLGQKKDSLVLNQGSSICWQLGVQLFLFFLKFYSSFGIVFQGFLPLGCHCRWPFSEDFKDVHLDVVCHRFRRVKRVTQLQCLFHEFRLCPQDGELRTQLHWVLALIISSLPLFTCEGFGVSGHAKEACFLRG